MPCSDNPSPIDPPQQQAIARAFEQRDQLSREQLETTAGPAIESTLDALEAGTLRVAEPVGACQNGQWQVHGWIKQAVLLSFRLRDNRPIQGGASMFFDKVPLRFSGENAQAELRSTGARVVPDALVRRGAFIGQDVVLMPSYVNIGAWVGPGTMVDTWATVGSCAQIGEGCHISGGAGIGGVLEPVQAAPTIIEDDCFIGARSEVVEGVIVERGSVISMGVFIGQSTRIYHRESGQVLRGRVPAGSVVVPGNLPAEDGSHSLYCAVIVKQVDASTRAKTSVNELLRSAE